MKYICPECGNKLLYCTEFIYEQRQLVNPETGEVCNEKIKTTPKNLDSIYGLRCINSDCNFIIDFANDILPENLKHLNDINLSK